MPMHTHILQSIHALLDFNHVSKEKNARAQYFSEIFSLEPQDSEKLLVGELVPSRALLKRIADKFEVDALWLLENKLE